MSGVDPKLFGERLTALLEDHSGTQKELAGEIGVSPNSICNWKRGEHVPHGGNLEQLALLLGVGIGELTGREPVGSAESSGEVSGAEAAHTELGERLAALDLLGSLEALQRSAPEIRRLGEAIPDLMEVLAEAQRGRGG